MPRFSLRDVFWLILVGVCLAGWWLERQRGEYERATCAGCGEAKAAQKDLELLTKLLKRKGINWGDHDKGGIYIESKRRVAVYPDDDSNWLDEPAEPPGGPPILPDLPPDKELKLPD